MPIYSEKNLMGNKLIIGINLMFMKLIGQLMA